MISMLIKLYSNIADDFRENEEALDQITPKRQLFRDKVNMMSNHISEPGKIYIKFIILALFDVCVKQYFDIFIVATTSPAQKHTEPEPLDYIDYAYSQILIHNNRFIN